MTHPTESQPDYQSAAAAAIVADRIREVTVQSLANFGLDASRVRIEPWHTGGGIFCAAVFADGELFAYAAPEANHLGDNDPWAADCIGVDWYVLSAGDVSGDRTEYSHSDGAMTPEAVALAVIELMQEGGFRA
jgi:hypothetical protein